MRKNLLVAILTTFTFLTLIVAEQAKEPSPENATAADNSAQTVGRLPVKRVVLYKNGVGYFEHSTRVNGTLDLNIDFTSAQLNDALKSLTVVDLGDGRITGVRFNSVAPLSERLKTLRLPLGEEASRSDLLEALRGARVEVHTGSASAAGKVLGIDVRRIFGASANQMEEVTVLTLVTDEGDVRSFDLGPSTSVRIADRELADEVNRYLNLIGSAKAVDLRRLTISAAGTGEREIFVSYISEVPVWKSTYRILLDSKHEGNPLVQGWAVVDNTIGEDWNNVQLSLVAGAPQLFVQNISQPMYVRRPEVALPESAMLTPQTHESAMNELPPPQEAAPPPPPPPPSAAPGMGGGYGSSSGGPMRRQSESMTVEGNASAFSRVDLYSKIFTPPPVDANAKEIGDFFEYDLKGKVSIGKNQSALVPILQARIDAESVTIWNEDSGQPLRALWLNNTSGLEFDAGSFNILEDGTFAGEGMLAPLRPSEKRLITYAADPAVRVKVVETPTEKPFSRVQIIKGVMIMTREERESKTYTVSTSDSTTRDVLIEYPIRPDWKLAEGTKPEETTPSLYRFRVKVEPKTASQLVVEEYHPISTQVELSNVTDEEVTLLSDQKRLTPELQLAIKQVLDQKVVVEKLDEQAKTRMDEEASITADQGRIRENMKALKGSVEERALVQRYTHQLDQQEDRLATLRSQIADLQAKSQQASDQLDKIIAEISLDETF
jgi:hypothetical protein